MRRIPIYQMSLGVDQNGRVGFLFPSEIEDESNQSIIFALPFTHPFHHPFDLGEYLERNEFYFPIEINGKYQELKAKVDFPELIFSVPNTEYKIAFQLEMGHIHNWPMQPFGDKLKYKYIGKSNNIIPKNNGFLTLLPVDLYELDEFYMKHKGIFVGLTPNFGNKENLNFS